MSGKQVDLHCASRAIDAARLRQAMIACRNAMEHVEKMVRRLDYSSSWTMAIIPIMRGMRGTILLLQQTLPHDDYEIQSASNLEDRRC